VKRKPVPRKKPVKPAKPATSAARARRATTVTKAELESLRADLKRVAGGPARWNADPEDVQRSVVRLVLALVEFLRKLMERQAIRRMEAGTLEPQQIEDMGLALMRLEETVVDMAARFGLTPEELNLDLGPLGKLM
jgi:hypothetical protein